MPRPCIRLKRPHSSKAQILLDFILPVVLTVLLVSAVVGLYGAFQEKNREKIAQPLATEAEAELLEKIVQSSPMAQDDNLTPITIVTPDGTVFRLKNYPKSLKKSIERHGSDGTTSLLAANLLTLAQQMKEHRKLTQKQFNCLQNLAIQGHHMAEIQGMIEHVAADSVGDKDRFIHARLTVGDYENRTPKELASLIGQSTVEKEVTSSTAPANSPNTPPKTKDIPVLTGPLPGELRSTLKAYDPTSPEQASIGHEMRRYLELTREANGEDSVSDPAIQSVINTLARNIYRISNDFNTTSALLDAEASEKLEPEWIRHQMAMRAETLNSMAICQQGGVKSTNVYCPK